VIAMVSVDIAGNSEGQDGVKDSTSPGSSRKACRRSRPSAEKLRLAVGNENDSPAREWARYVQRVGSCT